MSLYNDGPATVYLADNGSVNSYNGFPLSPTASTEWQVNKGLWIATELGSASIFVNEAGTTMDATRAQIDRLLVSVNSDTLPEPLEVAAFQSLILKFTVLATFTCPISFTWYDEDMNMIDEQEAQIWVYPTTNPGVLPFTITTPVRGSYVQFDLGGVNITDVKVYGSTRPRRFRWWHSFPVYQPGTTAGVIFCDTMGGSFFVQNWDGNPLTLPGWGPRLSMTVRTVGTIAGNWLVNIRGDFVQAVFRDPIAASGATAVYTRNELWIPLGEWLTVSFPTTAAAGTTLAIQYPDYSEFG